jgi:hypothetical protein
MWVFSLPRITESPNHARRSLLRQRALAELR